MQVCCRNCLVKRTKVTVFGPVEGNLSVACVEGSEHLVMKKMKNTGGAPDGQRCDGCYGDVTSAVRVVTKKGHMARLFSLLPESVYIASVDPAGRDSRFSADRVGGKPLGPEPASRTPPADPPEAPRAENLLDWRTSFLSRTPMIEHYSTTKRPEQRLLLI